MRITIITTGGTIDKVYYDALSEYQVGHTIVEELLKEVGVRFDYTIVPLMMKDSLEITDEDRKRIYEAVENTQADRVLITHGTDTMAKTGQFLKTITNKTVVLTGAFKPVIFRNTDAIFNVGFALGAVTSLPAGVYVAMQGRVFDPDHVIKDREQGAFLET